MDTQSPSESYQITFDVQRKKLQHCLIGLLMCVTTII